LQEKTVAICIITVDKDYCTSTLILKSQVELVNIRMAKLYKTFNEVLYTHAQHKDKHRKKETLTAAFLEHLPFS